jgi:ferredoxin
VLHKYLYVMQNTGLIACTGCGRCVRSCPVGINIKSVAESLMEAEK